MTSLSSKVVFMSFNLRKYSLSWLLDHTRIQPDISFGCPAQTVFCREPHAFIVAGHAIVWSTAFGSLFVTCGRLASGAASTSDGRFRCEEETATGISRRGLSCDWNAAGADLPSSSIFCRARARWGSDQPAMRSLRVPESRALPPPSSNTNKLSVSRSISWSRSARSQTATTSLRRTTVTSSRMSASVTLKVPPERRPAGPMACWRDRHAHRRYSRPRSR
mmetsp:Transcript_132681/g.264791  ORF Transcript_132681/g.264791 Transcript_132681/m.264791 type:complete len:220 (-) Transcript_132681:1882-2541(-)